MTDPITQIAGFIMVAGFALCYIPQLIKMVKTKKVKDVSIMMLIMTDVAYVASTIYMFRTQFGIWWFLNYVTGFIFCSTLIFLWFRYNKNENNKS